MKIAVMPGDGVGKEVVPEGLKVLNAVQPGFELDHAQMCHPLKISQKKLWPQVNADDADQTGGKVYTCETELFQNLSI